MFLVEEPLLSFMCGWHKYHPCGEDCGWIEEWCMLKWKRRLVAREEPLWPLGPDPQSLPTQGSPLGARLLAPQFPPILPSIYNRNRQKEFS